MSDVKITLAEVEHVARLARLALDADEKDRMRSQLDAILGYVEQLRRVDTAGVEPTAHVLPLVNVMRDDEVRPSYPVGRHARERARRAGRAVPGAAHPRGVSR